MPHRHTVRIVNDAGDTIIDLSEHGIYEGQYRLSPFQQLITHIDGNFTHQFIWLCQEGVWVITLVNEAHDVQATPDATLQLCVYEKSQGLNAGVPQFATPLRFDTDPNQINGVHLVAEPTPLTAGRFIGLEPTGNFAGITAILSVLLKRIE